MKTKFLSDGRKVVVIGQLNNIESIVQEIFETSDGDEIPSGEKFTTKNLHDEPVKSYKEKEIERMELKLNAAKLDYDSNIREIKSIQSRLRGFRAIFKQVDLLAKNIKAKELDVLVSVMSGSCEYVVIDSYSIDFPQPFDESLIRYENSYGERRFDSIKLVSFLGKAGGDPEYRINTYSDGSGSSTKIMPFNSYIEAVEYIKTVAKEKIAKDRLSIEEFKKCLSMDVLFTKAEIKKLKSKFLRQAKEGVKTSKAQHEKTLAIHEKTISSVNDIFNI